LGFLCFGCRASLALRTGISITTCLFLLDKFDYWGGMLFWPIGIQLPLQQLGGTAPLLRLQGSCSSEYAELNWPEPEAEHWRIDHTPLVALIPPWVLSVHAKDLFVGAKHGWPAKLRHRAPGDPRSEPNEAR
jgi:hypothetical protein